MPPSLTNYVLPKQDVVGSNPITRSTKLCKCFITLTQAEEIDIGKAGLNDLHRAGSLK